MIPTHVRVAALDNDKEHLNKIYSGLARAGYWVMPFHFDAGALSPLPSSPNNGIRIIFSDIHLVEGQMFKMTTHAQALISCLKRIVSEGPYIVIFWTAHPDDATEVIREVRNRIGNEATPAPVYFGTIDKNNVLGGDDQDFNTENLVELINTEIAKCGPLLLSISWEERVFQAAVRSTHRLFELAQNGIDEDEAKLTAWHKLLGFLALEAAGEEAKALPIKAMDLALLPLLEDRLQTSSIYAPKALQDMLSNELGRKPETISSSKLNTHYLVEVIKNPKDVEPFRRGVVSSIDTERWDASYHEEFGGDWPELIRKEFLMNNAQNAEQIARLIKPCLVTLTPECDDIQGKVGSYRYLLGALFKKDEVTSNAYYSRSKNQYSNLSIFEIGIISVNDEDIETDYVLLVSCNRFLARPVRAVDSVTPIYRLRRSVIEELGHHYATHARRPGVLRFRD